MNEKNEPTQIDIDIQYLHRVIEHYTNNKDPKNLGNLNKFLNTLLQIEPDDDIIELINDIIELVIEVYLIEGEKTNDISYFDSFCEFNYLKTFLDISNNLNIQDIHLQLVK